LSLGEWPSSRFADLIATDGLRRQSRFADLIATDGLRRQSKRCPVRRRIV
jgi:hypothetical protein